MIFKLPLIGVRDELQKQIDIEALQSDEELVEFLE